MITKTIGEDGLVRLETDSEHYLCRVGKRCDKNHRATVAPSAVDEWTEVSVAEVEAAERDAELADKYARRVEELIRERFSVNQELAILRQRDTKPDEFAEYDTFAEACKAQARAEVYGGLTSNPSIL